jgi:DNA-binding MarR family transcriptional regulator
VVWKLDGASDLYVARSPEPAQREVARLRGPKAGRLVRALVDTRPRYGVRELAGAIGVTPGYVSRLLDALDRDALIDRSPKGGSPGIVVREDTRTPVRFARK